MYQDQDLDMKIAGDKPSKSFEKNQKENVGTDEYQIQKANGNIKKAQWLGTVLAQEYIDAFNNDSFDTGDDDTGELNRQKAVLLSFTVSALIESLAPAVSTANIIKAAFYDELCNVNEKLYERSLDTGAFSFYYLSYRRGTEVERRIGQTFAMLCSHDGDPIYQELGEALYCWFASVVQKQLDNTEFVF